MGRKPDTEDSRRQEPSRPAAVTQAMIAEKLGVSSATVSMGLRSDPRLQAETIARVQAAAAELGYDPHYHDAARRLALHRRGKKYLNRVVALHTPTVVGSRYFSLIFEGIASQLAAEGYSLLVNTPVEPEPHPIELPAIVSRGEVDALIAMSAPEHLRPLVRRLRSTPGFRDRPVVAPFYVVPGCGSVYSDDQLGAYQAARHLLELGHRQLMCFAFDSFPHQLRLRGLQQAFSEFGLAPDKCLHRMRPYPGWSASEALPANLDNGLSRQEAVEHPFIHYLREHPQITALLGANDASVLSAWRVLHAAGARVPEDLSLVGFDDVDPLPGPEQDNMLNSVRIPLQELGREAARMALGMISGELPAESRVVLPTAYIPRQSVGPPRCRPLVLA